MVTKKNTGIEFEKEFETDVDTQIDEKIFKIRYWNTTYTFERIAQLYNQNKFVKPDLQRSFVWNQDMASRLIDSILLGIPLPNFFIYKNEDDSNDIIDGLQRIITLSTFINGKSLPGKSQIFKLSKSPSINKKWQGKTFEELTIDEQDRIRDGEATIVFFEQRYPDNNKLDIKRHVFERINTGGIKLTSQEIRNALYPGEFNNRIKSLSLKWSNYETRFSQLDYKKFKIDELILRILTTENIVNKNYQGYEKSIDGVIQAVPVGKTIILRKQIDAFMEYNIKGYERIELFERALDFYYSEKRNNFLGKTKNNINAIYAETIFIILMKSIQENTIIEFSDEQYSSILSMNSNEKLPFTKRTTNIDNLKQRIAIFQKILSSGEN